MREGAMSFRLLPEIGDYMYSADFDLNNGKIPQDLPKPTIDSFMEGEHSFGRYCERVICRQEDIDCREKYSEFVAHMEEHHDGKAGDPFWKHVNSPGPSLIDGTRNRDTRYRAMEEYRYDLGEAPTNKKHAKKVAAAVHKDSRKEGQKEDTVKTSSKKANEVAVSSSEEHVPDGAVKVTSKKAGQVDSNMKAPVETTKLNDNEDNQQQAPEDESEEESDWEQGENQKKKKRKRRTKEEPKKRRKSRKVRICGQTR